MGWRRWWWRTALRFSEGDAIAENFQRPEQIPSYYAPAARYLDAQGDATRVLIEPGEDFADYDWGNTIDPIWPGIMTRPEVLREQLIQGSYPTTDLLQAFDLTLQQGTYEPSTLAPIARLFSAGDVVLQSNLAFWRYNTPRPQADLGAVRPAPRRHRQAGHVRQRPCRTSRPLDSSLLDEEALALPANAPWPPPIAVFPVSDAAPHLPGGAGRRPARDRRQRGGRRRSGGGRPPRRQSRRSSMPGRSTATPSCCTRSSLPERSSC